MFFTEVEFNGLAKQTIHFHNVHDFKTIVSRKLKAPVNGIILYDRNGNWILEPEIDDLISSPSIIAFRHSHEVVGIRKLNTKQHRFLIDDTIHVVNFYNQEDLVEILAAKLRCENQSVIIMNPHGKEYKLYTKTRDARSFTKFPFYYVLSKK